LNHYIAGFVYEWGSRQCGTPYDGLKCNFELDITTLLLREFCTAMEMLARCWLTRGCTTRADRARFA
jgi:hypothetical protein